MLLVGVVVLQVMGVMVDLVVVELVEMVVGVVEQEQLGGLVEVLVVLLVVEMGLQQAQEGMVEKEE